MPQGSAPGALLQPGNSRRSDSPGGRRGAFPALNMQVRVRIQLLDGGVAGWGVRGGAPRGAAT